MSTHTENRALVTYYTYSGKGEKCRRTVQVRVTKTQYVLEGPNKATRRFSRRNGSELPKGRFRFCSTRDYIEALTDDEVTP